MRTTRMLLAIGCVGAIALGILVSNGSGYTIPAPAAGQWVTFGGVDPQVVNGSFNFHCCDTSQFSGYYYTQLPVAPTVGQTLTLNYTVTGNNPVWAQAPAGGGNAQTDINPPTIHLFLWRRGDNLSCAAGSGTQGSGGYADYRLFAARTPLVLGANQTISVKLDPTQWTGCWGNPPANMQDELNNLLGAGVTFGGQNFAGRGIYLSGGSATFTISSFTVQ